MAKILSVVHSDPEILGGTPVFVGTRSSAKTCLTISTRLMMRGES
jgi:uncharacterized protein (DUF433 family)